MPESKLIEAVDRSLDQKKPSKSRKNLYGVIGGIIILFAVIGFISSVIFTTQFVVSIVQNQSDKDKFANYLYPLVMLDPPAFNDVSALDPSTILAAGAWNFIMNADLSKYEKDEFGFITVPQTDIDVYITKLFGTGLSYQHQSIGDAEYSFTYNAEDKTYNIASSSLYYSYVPQVSQIIRTGKDLIELNVEYIVPTIMLNKNKSNSSPAPAKVMKYTLEDLGKDSYKVLSVSILSSGGSVVQSSSSSSSDASSGSASSSVSSSQSDAID